MAATPEDFRDDSFGTLAQKLNGGGGDTHIQLVSTTTSNAAPVQLFQHTLDPSSTVAFRATIV